MTTMSEQDWQALADAELVTGSIPPAQYPDSPWYVRGMLGAAGWIAALLLLGFVAVGLAWIMKSEFASTLVGIAMMATAWLMLFKLSRNDFAVQFALAVSFAGQVLFAVGIFGWLGLERDATLAWLVMALAQAGLAAVMPTSTHRLWSSFAATVAFSMVLYSLHLSFISPAIILAVASWAWLGEFNWPGFGPHLRPMAYGLVLALVAMDVATGAFHPLTGMGVQLAAQNGAAPWAGQLLLGAVLLAVIWVLLRRWQVSIPGPIANAAFVAAILLVLVSLKAPGISVGVCILLLGYAHGNRMLTGLGIAALLLYLSTCYYSLNDTLLVKSQALAISGALLLTLRWLLLRWLPGDGEPGDA